MAAPLARVALACVLALAASARESHRVAAPSTHPSHDVAAPSTREARRLGKQCEAATLGRRIRRTCGDAGADGWPRRSPGQLPGFVDVSPEASGSAAVFFDLVGHPQVADAVSCKEVCTLRDRSNATLNNATALAALEYAYKRMFPRTSGPKCAGVEWVTAEGCPGYLGDAVAAPLLRRVAPKAKVFLLARDPVARFLSQLAASFRHDEKRGAGLGRTCADRLAAGAATGVDAADAYVAAGSYANHLDAIWRPSFGDENLAVFAAEWFFPAGPDNATDVADAAHRVLVNFLGLRSWSPEALEGRDSLAYGREAWLARKAGDAAADDDAPRWACGDGDLADLAAFYAPQNGRVAGDVARAVATYAMIWDRKFLLARLPGWLTPNPPRRAHYARLQRRLESDGPWV